MTHWTVLTLLAGLVPAFAQAPAWKDPSPHITHFVPVANGVRLEVLDWGGAGRPLVLLAGGGDTAHVFDDFAPKLRPTCHVYAITRRGFGASGFSSLAYNADGLGDDVRTVIDALKLTKPVLAAHSLGGEELSSVATRYPERIAGVTYLDAAYPYAFDDGHGPSMQDIQSLQAPQPPEPGPADLASFQALNQYFERVNGFPYPEAELRDTWESTPEGRVLSRRDFPGSAQLLNGMKKYPSIPVPALAIFANPHGLGSWVDHNQTLAVTQAAATYTAALSSLVTRQITGLQHAVPAARIVVLPGAHHYVYLSNEKDVLREIRRFLASIH